MIGEVEELTTELEVVLLRDIKPLADPEIDVCITRSAQDANRRVPEGPVGRGNERTRIDPGIDRLADRLRISDQIRLLTGARILEGIVAARRHRHREATAQTEDRIDIPSANDRVGHRVKVRTE